jgi:hypothetical protein
VPAAYFQQTTCKLQRAVTTILTEGNLADSLEELYRGVENLVREKKGGELYSMLRESCRSFVAETLKSNVERGIMGSIGIGGDGGLRAAECIESSWAKWTSQLVLFPGGGSLMIGTYSEYFLLPGQSAYYDESKTVIYNVCNSDAVLTIGIWDMDSFAIAFFVTNLH